VAKRDREHWDDRYTQAVVASQDQGPVAPATFKALADRFPRSGTALEIACGRGRAAVWLADRGMSVVGYDISPVAVELAGALAEQLALSHRCTFGVADFDDGLPPGEPVDLILCHMFRNAALDRAMVQRLRPGGLLAIAVLSEVGAGPGRFRAPPGTLTAAFHDLDLVAHGEGSGTAWLLGRRPSQPSC